MASIWNFIKERFSDALDKTSESSEQKINDARQRLHKLKQEVLSHIIIQNTPNPSLNKQSFPACQCRFSIEKESYRGAEFATDPETVKRQILDTVFDFFPDASVDAKIELSAFDNSFNTYHRKFFVIVSISDSSLTKADFDENVTYLKQALKVL